MLQKKKRKKRLSDYMPLTWRDLRVKRPDTMCHFKDVSTVQPWLHASHSGPWGCHWDGQVPWGKNATRAQHI